jgi:hypothetical protein
MKQICTRVLLASLSIGLSSCGAVSYHKAETQCGALAPGMTEAQVLSVMGAPQLRQSPTVKSPVVKLWYSIGGDVAPIVVVLTRAGSQYVTSNRNVCGA